MTQEFRTAYPIVEFQMWDRKNKILFTWADNRVMIAAHIATGYGEYRLLPYTGLQDSLGNKLYLDDVCQITLANDFGSVELLLVQVSFFPDFAAFGFNGRTRPLMPDMIRNIKKVGNINANPELLPHQP